MERKLAAILCADVFGYSRLMGEDEEATLRTLTSYRKLIDSQIENHHGRFVNSAGDSVLAEFASVVEAVNCAVEIQTGLQAENASIAPERRMEFRIGVNLGDEMGRYQEAVPLLKQNLAAYPNNLVSHLFLASTYVELGRDQDASAEAAEIMRISPHYALASLPNHGDKHEALNQRVRSDLLKAGLK
jgi:tetratricopeptide (TPR) repeat protein